MKTKKKSYRKKYYQVTSGEQGMYTDDLEKALNDVRHLLFPVGARITITSILKRIDWWEKLPVFEGWELDGK